jgi:hypothetical protein
MAQHEKYDLQSQLLAAKNEISELEIKLHEAEKAAQQVKLGIGLRTKSGVGGPWLGNSVEEG